MGQRPSQCRACGMFEMCLSPEDRNCAEKSGDPSMTGYAKQYERTNEKGNPVADKKPRRCYYTNDAFVEEDKHVGVIYTVAEVVENEAGYTVASKHTSKAAAESAMAIRNAALGIKWDDVLDIVASSFAAGPVKS